MTAMSPFGALRADFIRLEKDTNPFHVEISKEITFYQNKTDDPPGGVRHGGGEAGLSDSGREEQHSCCPRRTETS